VAPAQVPAGAWQGLQPAQGLLPAPSAPAVEPSAAQALLDAGASALDLITSAALDAAAGVAMDAAAAAAPVVEQPGMGQALLRGVFGYLRRRARPTAVAVGTAAVAGLLAGPSTSSSSSSSSAAAVEVLPPRQEEMPHDAFQ